MKKSIVVKEKNGIELERTLFNSLKLALEFYKKQKSKLMGWEKDVIKFRIIQKNEKV